jgi:hypothetical protein
MAIDDELEAEVDEVLALGIVNSNTDGTSVTHNLDQIRQSRAERLRADPAAAARHGIRPTVMNGRTPFRG